ncbi:MAG: GxxExxY protein [Bacteroidales bacterium]|jgi:GxxExxY protein|nr:GxxExxY protein [Bacteroidales bacterium]
MLKSEYERLSHEILDSSLSVHKEMGPGLLESVYQYCLVHELRSRNVFVQEQVSVPLFYKNQILDKDFRLDLLVAEEIIIEIKAVEVILPVHEAQIISYLKLADKRLGFLINFNVPLLKSGFRRFVNNY